MKNSFREPLPGLFHLTAVGVHARGLLRWLSGHQSVQVRALGTERFAIIIVRDTAPDTRPYHTVTEALELSVREEEP